MAARATVMGRVNATRTMSSKTLAMLEPNTSPIEIPGNPPWMTSSPPTASRASPPRICNVVPRRACLCFRFEPTCDLLTKRMQASEKRPGCCATCWRQRDDLVFACSFASGGQTPTPQRAWRATGISTAFGRLFVGDPLFRGKITAVRLRGIGRLAIPTGPPQGGACAPASPLRPLTAPGRDGDGLGESIRNEPDRIGYASKRKRFGGHAMNYRPTNLSKQTLRRRTIAAIFSIFRNMAGMHCAAG